ncbi:MAG: hypothetical protein NTW10_12940 [Bacteroidetes bacterium]|nr:hypothetical protein [Bacteroidota bacterium]
MKHLLPGIKKFLIANSAAIVLLLSLCDSVYAEGTKQVLPDSTVSSASLMIDRNNPMYTRFGYIGCPANYRLYIHIKNVGETILFGLQSPVANVGYNLRRPNGTIAMTGNLPSAPAPGYIRYYRNAVVGPFQAYSGYNPLSQKVVSIADTGNWYFEIKSIPGGNGTVEFTYFDFQVVTGLNLPALPADTINGRVWSQSWQFYANLGGNNTYEPFNAALYVYSDDGITTRIKFSGVHWGEGTIFCNPVGCLNTGNFPVDRQSNNNNTYATFPGIAWYKVFLSNPDSLVYPDGQYGRVISDPTMIDDPNYPVCSGRKYIEVVVNKKGRIIVDIDIPYGDSTYDVLIESDVNPGLNHIPWGGLDGHGGQVPAGTWLMLAVTFINGLTNLPLWDIEQNPLGYKVSLIRPRGPALSEPLIYWDDSQLTNDGNCPNAPTTVNLGGCDPTTSVCHDWAGIDCHEKMINSWWYSGSSSYVPLWVYYSKTPDNPVASNRAHCGPGIDTLHATVVPAAFTADWYSAATGGTLLLAGSTTFVTPLLNATTTFYVLTRDPISGCISQRVPVTVTINPLPVPTLTGPALVCVNSSGNVYVTEPGMTNYIWNVSPGGTITSGGTPASNTVTVTWNTAGVNTVSVIYTDLNGCTSAGPAIFNVTVYDPPSITVQPSNTSVCEGFNTLFTVTALGSGLTYQWQVNSGSGWSNVSDGGVYGGAMTNTLTITGATTGMTGYQYRCIVTGTCLINTTTNPATLTVTPIIPTSLIYHN